jgi:hypothetical protein
VHARLKTRLNRVGAAMAALALTASYVVGLAGPAAADHPPGTVAPYDWACDAAPEDGFTDVSSENVHEPAIDCAVAHELVAGTSPTTYSPGAPVSRAQMATFIARLMSNNSVFLPGSPPDAFDDDGGSAHEGSINRLAAVGVVRGTAERTYSPTAAVTRGQMATYLVRAYELIMRMELPQALNRFGDDTQSSHRRFIDQLAGLRIASGVGPATYVPDGVVRRDQMARFLSGAQGCVQPWPRDGSHHFPECDAYTETDSAEALQGFGIEVSTDSDHYSAGQGVHVAVDACNRRSTELRQVFPQKDWFVLEVRHEQRTATSPWIPDRTWYDHRWLLSWNRSGYGDRSVDPLARRLLSDGRVLSATTWHEGPQTSPDEVVVWEPGECKRLPVDAWQQVDKNNAVTDLVDQPGAWRTALDPVSRTTPGWHRVRLNWGGVEVGQARRYLTVDSPRFNLDGPRVTATVERRRYEPDEPVPVTVSACNDSDVPYEEYIGQRNYSGERALFRLAVKGNLDHATHPVDTVIAADEHMAWAAGECRTWELLWDQRLGDRSPVEHELIQLEVSWNDMSEERPQFHIGPYFSLR